MGKTAIGAKTFLYPQPVALVGTNIGGTANYLTVAYCGIVQHNPAISTMKPIIFSMHDNTYGKVGEYLGRAWELGKKLL